VLTVLLLLAAGVAAGRVRSLPPGTATAIDWVVIRLSLPGLIVARVPGITLDPATVVPVAVAWGVAALLVGAVLLAGRLARWSTATVGTLLLVVPLGNTSFLGIPAVEALLGAEHVPYAVVYDQLGSFLLLATYGSVVAARWGAGADPTPAAVARRVLTFPPFVALLAALVLRATGVPGPVAELASALGATLTPLTMLSVGLRLRLPDRAASGPLALGLGLRLVAAPAVVLAFAVGLGTVGGGAAAGTPAALAWSTSVLEAGMPPMVTASVVAIDAGLDERLAAALVGGGILVALVTLPLLAALLG
jgi:malate permease and related proteins